MHPLSLKISMYMAYDHTCKCIYMLYVYTYVIDIFVYVYSICIYYSHIVKGR